jgi:protein phosphatase 1 regulatory subunit 7
MKNPFSRSKICYPVIVLTLSLIVSCSSDDENTQPTNDIYLSIPDIHFETKLVEQGIDTDGLVNQQMLKTDAEKISRLDLNLSANSGGIDDLTGIEGFINLKLLSASNQELESIDLSYNTQLDTLYLLGNKFSSIDLSNNSNLIFVDIQVNQFSSGSSIIGLSNATNLKNLDISHNYLEGFSIHNESLEVLHISHNDLKSLDTDGLINLQHVFIPFNKLEAVDFSTNTSLETLLISANKLQHIDLENNSSLTHLYIVDNSLTSLDVSNNQELADLRVNRNPELTCIKIKNGQNPYVMKSDYQELNTICN